MTRTEIISGVERRRRWSDTEKLRILAEADEPGVRIGEVARRHDIYPAQIRLWWETMSAQAAPVAAFVPVNLVDDGVVERTAFARPTPPSTASTAKAMMLEITLRNGRSLRAPANIDRKALASLICCVEAA